MPIAFLKTESRILEYYFRVYEAFGCNKTFTSMMFKEVIDTKNPQEGIAKLRFGKLVEKAKPLDGKFGYKLLNIKKIVAKANANDAIKILKKFSKLSFVDRDTYADEVVKALNCKYDKGNLLYDVISQIPFRKYSKTDKAKVIAELFGTTYSNLEVMSFAYKLLGCPDNLGAVNTNIPVLVSAISVIKDTVTLYSAYKSENITELLGIDLQEKTATYENLISNFCADIKKTRDVENLENAIKSYTKKAVCLTFSSTTSNGGTAYKLRQELVLNNEVEAVIALSKKTFSSKTLIMPIVIVLNKEKETEKIQFINATGENDLSKAFAKILEAFNTKTEIVGFSRNVSALEVIKNGNYLDPTSYVKSEKPLAKVDLSNQIELLEKLEKEREEISSKLRDVITQNAVLSPTVTLGDVCILKKTRIAKSDLETKTDEDCILVYASSVKLDEIGTPYYPLDNYKPGDYTKVTVKDSSVKKEYLYQVLSSTEFKDYVSNVMKGTIVKVVSTSDISKFTFKLPAAETQERVITLYKDLDNATNNLLDSVKQMEVIKANLLSHITN